MRKEIQFSLHIDVALWQEGHGPLGPFLLDYSLELVLQSCRNHLESLRAHQFDDSFGESNLIQNFLASIAVPQTLLISNLLAAKLLVLGVPVVSDGFHATLETGELHQALFSVLVDVQGTLAPTPLER